MKTPPKAKVQKVCRTKGSGSSLQQTPASHCAQPQTHSAFPSSWQQRSAECRAETPLQGRGRDRGQEARHTPHTHSKLEEGSISPASSQATPRPVGNTSWAPGSPVQSCTSGSPACPVITALRPGSRMGSAPRHRRPLPGDGVDLLDPRDEAMLGGHIPHTPQAAHFGRPHDDNRQLP